jgi:GTP-binding protein EngB required for normal cell division
MSDEKKAIEILSEMNINVAVIAEKVSKLEENDKKKTQDIREIKDQVKKNREDHIRTATAIKVWKFVTLTAIPSFIAAVLFFWGKINGS